MILRSVTARVLAAAAAVALLSCNATRPPGPSASPAPAAGGAPVVDLQAIYTELARAGGKIFTLSPEGSTVRIYAFRAGRVARLGHNHVLSAPRFTGFFYLPSSGAAHGRFDLAFRLDQLEIDDPAYRSELGPAFSARVSPDDIEGTREHLLGPDGLQADGFPFVYVRSLQISGEAPKFAVRTEIEMHGHKMQIWVPMTIQGLPDRLTASGSFVLRQTDFGVQPYSVLGGMLAVQDEIVLEFTLTGSAAPGS